MTVKELVEKLNDIKDQGYGDFTVKLNGEAGEVESTEIKYGRSIVLLGCEE